MAIAPTSNRPSTSRSATDTKPSSSSSSRSYEVKAGDTLSAIAQAFGLSTAQLHGANPQITDPDRIVPGQQLAVPDGGDGTYTVRKGDTLSKLAKQLGTNVDALLGANPEISNPNQLRAGQALKLPAAASTKAADSAKATGDTKASSDAKAAGETAAAPKDGFEASPAPAQIRPEVPKEPAPTAPGGEKLDAATLTAARLAPPKESPLPKALRKPAWKALTEGVDLDKSVKLGPANVKVQVAERALSTPSTDPVRKSYDEQVKKAGLEPLWVESKGKLEVNGGAQGTNAGVQLEGGLGYTLTRPYAYPKGKGDPVDLSERLAKTNTTELPLNAKKAEALEPGSTFEVEGRVKATATGNASGVSAEASVAEDRKVSIKRLEGSLVEVTLEKNGARNLKGDAATDGLSVSGQRSEATGEVDRFTLDLKKPGARKAYDKLVQLDDGDAEDLAANAGSGVTHERVRQSSSRTVEGSARSEQSIGENTDVSVGLRRSTSTTRDELKDTTTRTGTLGAEIDLTHRVNEDVTLGFTADKERSYRLDLPKGVAQDTAPPVRADDMKALPAGTELQLSGSGKVGATVGNGTLDAGLTREGQIDVTARRGEGATVDVEVSVTRQTTQDRGAQHGTALGEGTLDLGYQGSTTFTREKSGNVRLDLDKPAHRDAYDALMKGDIGPARAIAKGSGDWSEDEGWTSKDAFQVTAKPVEWVGASVRVESNNYGPSDAKVAGDADRKAFTEKAQADGKDVRWIESRGAIEPSVGHTVSAPIGAVGTATVGFEAKKLVEYSEMRPQVDGAMQGESGPALTADKALEMPRGTEFTLRGQGSVRGTVGVSVGKRVGNDVATVGVSAGLERSQSASRELEIRGKRLDGDRVEVEFLQGKSREGATTVGASVGVDVEIPGDGTVSELARKGKLDERLEQRLSAKLEHVSRDKTSLEREHKFTLDVSSPAGKQAYESLVKGDPEPALKLAREGAAGVSMESKTTETEERESKTNVEVFGTKLFLSEALTRDKHVVIEGAGGKKEIDAFTHERHGENIFSGKRDFKVEHVRVRTSGDPEGKSYFRMSFHHEDKYTSKNQLKDLVHLGESTAAVPARDVKAEEGERKGIGHLMGNGAKHGKTTTDVEIFLTEKGLRSLRDKGAAAAMDAYGEHVASREGEVPAWSDPKHKQEARAMLREYQEIDKSAFPNDERAESDKNWIESQYWHKFKRNLYEDYPSYKDAASFGRVVDEMGKSDDPTQWGKAFEQHSREVGFDVYGTMGAVSRLAGNDELLVHKMQMKGKAVDVEMRDEGMLARPE